MKISTSTVRLPLSIPTSSNLVDYYHLPPGLSQPAPLWPQRLLDIQFPAAPTESTCFHLGQPGYAPACTPPTPSGNLCGSRLPKIKAVLTVDHEAQHDLPPLPICPYLHPIRIARSLSSSLPDLLAVPRAGQASSCLGIFAEAVPFA